MCVENASADLLNSSCICFSVQLVLNSALCVYACLVMCLGAGS